MSTVKFAVSHVQSFFMLLLDNTATECDLPASDAQVGMPYVSTADIVLAGKWGAKVAKWVPVRAVENYRNRTGAYRHGTVPVPVPVSLNKRYKSIL